jgi:hypothetical protein
MLPCLGAQGKWEWRKGPVRKCPDEMSDLPRYSDMDGLPASNDDIAGSGYKIEIVPLYGKIRVPAIDHIHLACSFTQDGYQLRYAAIDPTRLLKSLYM